MDWREWRVYPGRPRPGELVIFSPGRGRWYASPARIHTPAKIQMQIHYQRILPHILPPGESLFITYRLAGSIPTEVLSQLLEEKERAIRYIVEHADTPTDKRVLDEHKRLFARIDTYLDQNAEGPHWLTQADVVAIVKEGIHHRDGADYELHAYFIMSNHVHLLVTIRCEHRPFYKTLKSLKGFSARKINELLNRTGQPFWQPESYDHVVRSASEFNRIVAYILNNPVKAGLVESWDEWPNSYWADN